MKPGESFVGQPIRSLQTMLRVIAEYDGSIPTVVPDGIYGKETVASITQFQKNIGITPTGITDQFTWEQIVSAYDDAIVSIDKAEPIEIIWDPNLVYILGDASPNILLAQSMLLYLSKIHEQISEPSLTGMLDQETAKAISAFQLLSELPSTGNLDKKTWKYLSKQFTLNGNIK